MIAVHSRWHPRSAIEIATRKQPSRVKQKNLLAEAPIREKNPRGRQFLVGEPSATGQTLKSIRHRLASAVVEKPEASHRRIEDRKIVFRHSQLKGQIGRASCRER